MRSKWLKYGGTVLVAALMIAVVAGCSSSQPASSGSTSTAPAKATVKAAMVTDIGGLGDKSFNDLSYAGLQRANKELGTEIKVLESKAPTDYESNLTNAANAGFNPIFAVGFLMQDTVSKVSTAYPDVNFGGIDESFNPPIANVVGLNFKEQEGAYLAGFLAGKLTTLAIDPRLNAKPILGFVGGMDIPPVQRYQAGYIAGAKAANPAVEVKSIYTGSFTDQQKGIEAGKALIGQGADIIFAAAGQTGLGTAKACQDNKALFIGVDADQFLTIPAIADTIITSAVKKVDTAVFDSVKLATEGKLKGGADVLYGLKEDGVGLAPYHDWDAKVPADVKAGVEKAKADIIAGTVVVPTTPPK